MKKKFLVFLGILLALLLLTAGLAACGEETPATSDDSGSTLTSSAPSSGSAGSDSTDRPSDSTAPSIPTGSVLPVPGAMEGLPGKTLTLARGEKKDLELPGSVRIVSLNPSVAAVGDPAPKENGNSQVPLVGCGAGETYVAVLSADGKQAGVMAVQVYEPLPEGETRNCLPEGILSCEPSNSPGNEGITNLADGRIDTKWLVFGEKAVITAELPRPAVVSSFALTSANDDPGRDPRDFTLAGSADGVDWTVLFETTGESFQGRRTTNTYSFDNKTAYRYYRLDIRRNNGDGEVQLSEWTLTEVGGKKTPPAEAPAYTKPATDVTKVVPSVTALTLPAGRETDVTVTTQGGASPVLCLSTTGSMQVAGLWYDAASGTTTVRLKACGQGRGRLLLLSLDGFVTADLPVSAIGEGACTNVTPSFALEGTSENKKVNVNRLVDDDRTTEYSGGALDLIFTAGDPLALVNRYGITGGADTGKAPVSFALYGSADQTNWKLLDERKGERFEGQYLRRVFDFDNTVAYPYYRLHLEGDGGLALAEVQLFEMGAYPSWALGPFEKQDAANPILTPNDVDWFIDPVSGQKVFWSNEALYNPAAVVKDGVICVLYRSQDHPLVSRIGLALSLDGIHFAHLSEPVVYPEKDAFYPYEEGGGDEDPRVIRDADGTYYMYYSSYNRSQGMCWLYVATSRDLEHWEKQGNAIGDAYNGKYRNLWAKSASVICDMVGEEFIARKFEDGKYYMYFGEGTLYLAWSYDLIHWTPVEDESGRLVAALSPRPGYYDSRLVECGPPAIYTEYGILLIYNGANADPKGTGDSMLVYNAYSPGQVVFDPKDPSRCIRITENCFMYPEKDYELEGLVNNVCFVEGLVYYHGSWYLYYGTADSRLAVAVYHAPERDDSRLTEAIAAAEGRDRLSEAAKTALRIAKEAAVSAVYSQSQVDEIAARLREAIGG